MSTDLTISKQGSYLTQTRNLRISLEQAAPECLCGLVDEDNDFEMEKFT